MEEAPDRLIVIHGPNLGREYPLTGQETSIGRSTGNSITLPLPEISRRHARILLAGETYFLEDLGSTNGTYVNNIRLSEPVAIFDGDEIQLGDSFRLLFITHRGGMRPVAVLAGDRRPEPPFAARPALPEPYPDAEIPTPRPPLATGLDGQEYLFDEAAAETQNRRYFLWCGCATILLFSVCILSILFLDSYQQGRLLYCGGLSPFFELVLGPLGYNPICP